jgi:hypothetical protein
MSFGCSAIFDPLSGRFRFREEVGQLPGVELHLPCSTPREQLLPARFESPVQLGDERHRLGREDLRVFGSDAAVNFDAAGVLVGHGALASKGGRKAGILPMLRHGILDLAPYSG